MRKLKQGQPGVDLIALFFILPFIFIVFYTWGLRAGWGVLAVLECLLCLLQLNMYARTKNSWFLWLAASALIIAFFAIQVALYGLDKNDRHFVPLAAVVVIALVITGYIALTKKTKWRTRELFELAAMPVDSAKNGFTSRPLPVGKIEASAAEIDSFGRFLSSHMIAIFYREQGRRIFALASSWMKQNGFKGGYKNDTWVSFSDKGDVDVFISHEDYLLYKDTYSFDQLCSVLGNLFIEFFESYRKGEGTRIIDKLNSLNLNPITE